MFCNFCVPMQDPLSLYTSPAASAVPDHLRKTCSLFPQTPPLFPCSANPPPDTTIPSPRYTRTELQTYSLNPHEQRRGKIPANNSCRSRSSSSSSSSLRLFSSRSRSSSSSSSSFVANRPACSSAIFSTACSCFSIRRLVSETSSRSSKPFWCLRSSRIRFCSASSAVYCSSAFLCFRRASSVAFCAFSRSIWRRTTA